MSVLVFIQIENNDLCEIRIKGRLDFEKSSYIDKQLNVFINSNAKHTNSNRKIILNLKELDFVGSSGIGDFFESLKIFMGANPNLLVINMKFEFYKVLKLYKWDFWDRVHDKNTVIDFLAPI